MITVNQDAVLLMLIESFIHYYSVSTVCSHTFLLCTCQYMAVGPAWLHEVYKVFNKPCKHSVAIH